MHEIVYKTTTRNHHDTSELYDVEYEIDTSKLHETSIRVLKRACESKEYLDFLNDFIDYCSVDNREEKPNVFALDEKSFDKELYTKLQKENLTGLRVSKLSKNVPALLGVKKLDGEASSFKLLIVNDDLGYMFLTTMVDGQWVILYAFPRFLDGSLLNIESVTLNKI